MLTVLVLAVIAAALVGILVWLRSRWNVATLGATVYEAAARWTVGRPRSADGLSAAMHRGLSQVYVALPSGRKAAAPAICFRVCDSDFDRLDRRFDLGLLVVDLASTYATMASRNGWDTSGGPTEVVIEADPMLHRGWVPRGRVERDEAPAQPASRRVGTVALPVARPRAAAVTPAMAGASTPAMGVPTPAAMAGAPTPAAGSALPDDLARPHGRPDEPVQPAGRVPSAGQMPAALRSAVDRRPRIPRGPASSAAAGPAAAAALAGAAMVGAADAPVDLDERRRDAPAPTQLVGDAQQATDPTELVIVAPAATLELADGRCEPLSGVCMVGRDPDCAVVLKSARASRHHARLIEQPGGRWFVEDAHSSNGTWVNGRRLAPAEWVELNHGDRLVFGEKATAAVMRLAAAAGVDDDAERSA